MNKRKKRVITIVAVAILVVLLTQDLGDLVDSFNQGREAARGELRRF